MSARTENLRPQTHSLPRAERAEKGADKQASTEQISKAENCQHNTCSQEYDLDRFRIHRFVPGLLWLNLQTGVAE